MICRMYGGEYEYSPYNGYTPVYSGYAYSGYPQVAQSTQPLQQTHSEPSQENQSSDKL